MANSGVLGGGGYQGRYLEFAWQLIDQNIQSNTSQIYWRVTVVGGSSSYYYHYRDYADAFGQVLVNSTGRIKRYKGDLANGHKIIQHDANGNASFSAHVIAAIYSSGVNEDVTMAWTLPNIPRQAVITNLPEVFNDEENPWFDYSNPANWELKAWLEPNPNGPHLCERTFRGTDGRYTWELTEDERKQLRQACKGNTCKIRFGLYSNGETWASFHDRTFIIKNPSPTAGNAVWESTNLTDLTSPAAIVKGYSDIAVTVEEATPVKEATIKQYKVVVGDKVASGPSPGVFKFKNVSESIIRVFVEDSRGNTVEKILNIQTIYDYTAPLFTSLSLERTKGGIGTNTVLKFTGNWWNSSFDKADNSLSLQYFYKRQGNSVEWVQGNTNIIPSNFAKNKFENTVEIEGDLGANGFDAGENFDFKIIATDKITNTEKSVILTSGIPNMAIHKQGIAFGNFYDPDAGGAIQLLGKNIIDLFYPVGTQLINNNADFNPNTIYGIWEKKTRTEACMVTGSKIITLNTKNAALMHTFAEVQDLFQKYHGFTPTDLLLVGVTYTNGDGNASGVHIDSATQINNQFWVTLAGNVTGNYRVNYAYFYNHNEEFWERTN